MSKNQPPKAEITMKALTIVKSTWAERLWNALLYIIAIALAILLILMLKTMMDSSRSLSKLAHEVEIGFIRMDAGLAKANSAISELSNDVNRTNKASVSRPDKRAGQ